MKIKGLLLLSLFILLFSPGPASADISDADIAALFGDDSNSCDESFDRYLAIEDTIKEFTFASKPLSSAQKKKYCPALFQGAVNVAEMLDTCTLATEEQAEWTRTLNYLAVWEGKYCK